MIHDTYNPYTAVARSPSQWCVYVPSDQLSPTNDTTNVTLSTDALNLQSAPASVVDSQTSYDFEQRYVVPEVIACASEADIRSAGNPYSHHPNFTTPSQYFAHLNGEVQQKEVLKADRMESEDVLTVMDIQKLANPFGGRVNTHGSQVIHPPNDVTLNKTALTSESLAELQQLHVAFPYKGHPVLHQPTPSDTINKKLLSPESLYELAQLHFEEPPSNLLVMRDFSPQSLADLRELRNISQYSEPDVSTCAPISPRTFEWTERVAYGGI